MEKGIVYKNYRENPERRRKVKVSVIVAAYNAEKYVIETMESLANQSIDDYEIIVVNDGSTDNTLNILREYEDHYEHITVIDKENGGPSSARNCGLDLAKGEYVYFFDADDVLEPDALQALYDRAKEKRADLVIAKYDIFNRFQTFPVNGINDLVQMERIDKYDSQILWTFSLCNKLFRRSVIEQHGLRLPPISYSEDGAFLMRYVYRTNCITGLDRVIFHYRRMYDGEAESITASISSWKIKDYIEAHRIIIKAAEESIMLDYPQYEDIEEVKEKKDEIHKYLNEICRKEVQILLDQFYAKYWTLPEETARHLVQEINDKMASLDMCDISMLKDSHPEFALDNLPVEKEELLSHAWFTIALYGEKKDKEKFLLSVQSLTLQNLIAIRILLPSEWKQEIEEAGYLQNNMEFLDVSSRDELYYQALEQAQTPYITFADAKVSYANNAFKYVIKNFIKSSADFSSQLIYHRNFEDMQAVLLSSTALNSVKTGYENNPYLAMDYTLANKFFKTDFLKKQKPDKSKSLLSHLPQWYNKGYFTFMNDRIVFYEDLEETFIDYVGTKETIPMMKEYLVDRKADLNSPEIVPDLNEIMPKMLRFPSDKFGQILFRKIVNFLRRYPVKNRVLFFTVRKDGELEGNAKALYPYVKGKKVICAKRLPHNPFTKLYMYYMNITSRVIVTDDYNRYLRHFQLRQSQRVVQLWHACGAFKKFGQRGTNMSVAADHAYHVQYNMVMVSSDWIRGIYADAFDIDVHKVKALGCPRTDAFYDEKQMQQIKETVYQAHPEFRDRYVILYAPTFRDIGDDRTQFKPDLDFDRLSEELLPNQMFVICPHPVMKNKIVEKSYDNIKVIRDFSTNDMMLVSDLLVTDYSSVIFEYVLLRKPIAFYCYDLLNYNRGFYLNYPDDLPGDIYENQADLTAYLQSPVKDTLSDKYDAFIEKYMAACDGQSSERIAKVINQYMEEAEHE